MGYLLRKATAPITNSFGPNILQDFEKGKRFLDVLYWAAQHVNPHSDVDSFTNYTEKMRIPTFSVCCAVLFVRKGNDMGSYGSSA